MQTLTEAIQYTVHSKEETSKYSKQYTVGETQRILSNLADLIPDDGYTGFYVNKLKELGRDRFMELVAKARAGSDSPARLFAWMLKHHELVR